MLSSFINNVIDPSKASFLWEKNYDLFSEKSFSRRTSISIRHPNPILIILMIAFVIIVYYKMGLIISIIVALGILIGGFIRLDRLNR